jgi:dihydroorotate dehydrogenase (NAD+) catalytic subunit
VNGRFVKAALDTGFDVCTYKTVRSGKYPCHPWPNVVGVKVEGDLTLEQAEGGVVGVNEYKEPLSITNSFGVPSWEPDFWQKDMAEAVSYAKKGQVVIGSFQGTPRGNAGEYIKDFAVTAKLVKETGVKILEVNLSCPNEGNAHLLCFDLERTQKVVEAIKNEIGNTPLVIKIAYYKDQSSLEKLIEMVGKMVQGIEAINTIGAKILKEDGSQYLPGEGRLKSGVCGHAIKWAGLEMVERLKTLHNVKGLKFQIIGVGGVITPKDFIDYINMGAHVVLSATGAMWNPFLAQEIKK